MSDNGTIREPARNTPVARDADVLVAGGGIAGVAAAVCAARRGAKVLLVERYGYLGGITVAWPVPAVFQYGKPGEYIVQGFARELIDRLDAIGGWVGPAQADAVEKHADGLLDVELLKLLLAEMCVEAGVELLLHSWIAGVLGDDGRVGGVIVENKSQRMALRGEVIVDATGDADVAALAGARCLEDVSEKARDPETGSARATCSFGAKIEGVDVERFEAFKADEPEAYRALVEEMTAEGGVKAVDCPSLSMPGCSTNVWDLTRMELEGAAKLLRTVTFLRERMPGHENVKIRHIAPQLGVRLGRRVAGVETLTAEHREQALRGERDVCLFHGPGGKLVGIPYGCLIPETLDGVIIGSRSISVDHQTFGPIRLIGTAWGIGEAAGTAAGMAASEHVLPRDLDVARLREALIDQGAMV